MKRFGWFECLVAILSCAVAIVAFRPQLGMSKGMKQGRVQVFPSVMHDVSPPLRDLREQADFSSHPEEGEDDREENEQPSLRDILARFRPSLPDPVVQEVPGLSLRGHFGVQFDGMSASSSGWLVPDTNGAIGPTQYLEFLNAVYAIYDRTNGNLILGPEHANLLWQGFGGVCQTNNGGGDPIAQYDKAAGRWVLTQHAVAQLGSQSYQCVAVSETSDATGSYYRYAFPLPLSEFPDYPKISTWADGYYFSTDEFNQANLQQYIGPYVCAWDRKSMLQGLDATAQCFQLDSSYLSLLPSDWDGATAPPEGSPNYYMSLGSNELNEWQFHVDFSNPSNTTFIGPTEIPVANFTEACRNGKACVPQEGVSQKLDSIGDRIMYRLAYRNFGDHESLVVNHAVDAHGVVGVRWYEIRSPQSPVVYQQSTNGIQGANRWMASVAMDQYGDLAVGYSASSKQLYPSIRIAGREESDPLNTLRSEKIVLTGGGSESGSYRWGDYSSMMLDPLDDCTFWFTAEYEPSTGDYNWGSHIVSFAFPSCTSKAKGQPAAKTN